MWVKKAVVLVFCRVINLKDLFRIQKQLVVSISHSLNDKQCYSIKCILHIISLLKCLLF